MHGVLRISLQITIRADTYPQSNHLNESLTRHECQPPAICMEQFTPAGQMKHSQLYLSELLLASIEGSHN